YGPSCSQLGGRFGMTISFATAGIGPVFRERILGFGYLATQLKLQVHSLMLILTAAVFTVGVALFIYDFFRHAPKFEVVGDEDPTRRIDVPATPSPQRYA